MTFVAFVLGENSDSTSLKVKFELEVLAIHV